MPTVYPVVEVKEDFPTYHPLCPLSISLKIHINAKMCQFFYLYLRYNCTFKQIKRTVTHIITTYVISNPTQPEQLLTHKWGCGEPPRVLWPNLYHKLSTQVQITYYFTLRLYFHSWGLKINHCSLS